MTALPLCQTCLLSPPHTLLALRTRLNIQERKYADLEKVCRNCEGTSLAGDEITCRSLDCPVFYTRRRLGSRLGIERGVVLPVLEGLEGLEGVEMGERW